MRSLVIHAPKDLRLDEQEAGPLGPGEVLVRIAYGGICGSDMHYFNHGGFGTVRLSEPMVLGHEVSGVVQAVAADVSNVKAGDRVAINPSRPCGHCKFCLEGLPNHCLDMRFYGSAMRTPHVQGAFRELLRCDATQCFVVGDGVPMDIAALAEPFSVGLHAVSRAGSLLGKRVLIAGCGPIGCLTVAAARLHGAAEIVATDVADEALSVAMKMGADAAINVASDEGWVSRYSAGKGTFDVMIECSGNERALRAGLEVLRPRGTVVQLGLGGEISLPQNIIVGKELSILGSFRFHAEFGLAVQLISQRRMDLSPVISGTYAMDDALAAFAIAGDRTKAMKTQIVFS